MTMAAGRCLKFASAERNTHSQLARKRPAWMAAAVTASKLIGVRRKRGAFKLSFSFVFWDFPEAESLKPSLVLRHLQYFGILGSTRSAHASIPPARLCTFLNPACCRKATAF